ncbi:hypothetical protein FG386_001528 [Cryptosporidium ryanae]|uniref:uncharacterized protein n=1 Tax=Cryptosporidium ryanae TaxID=515981 RepID=UPI003519FCDB|nr:hypothetical protein FG386_001528 [Cryptosporidium ryanae]
MTIFITGFNIKNLYLFIIILTTQYNYFNVTHKSNYNSIFILEISAAETGDNRKSHSLETGSFGEIGTGGNGSSNSSQEPNALSNFEESGKKCKKAKRKRSRSRGRSTSRSRSRSRSRSISRSRSRTRSRSSDKNSNIDSSVKNYGTSNKDCSLNPKCTLNVAKLATGQTVRCPNKNKSKQSCCSLYLKYYSRYNECLSKENTNSENDKEISNKNKEIANFKDSCKTILNSNKTMFEIFYNKCLLFIDDCLKNVSFDELVETLLELWSSLAGKSFLNEMDKIPGFIPKDSVYDIPSTSSENLMATYLECLELIFIIINNMASFLDKKEKIRELKKEIEILKQID